MILLFMLFTITDLLFITIIYGAVYIPSAHEDRDATSTTPS